MVTSEPTGSLLSRSALAHFGVLLRDLVGRRNVVAAKEARPVHASSPKTLDGQQLAELVFVEVLHDVLQQPQRLVPATCACRLGSGGAILVTDARHSPLWQYVSYVLTDILAGHPCVALRRARARQRPLGSSCPCLGFGLHLDGIPLPGRDYARHYLVAPEPGRSTRPAHRRTSRPFQGPV
jgi:hypothetical protein